jgi:hypothetical protein
MECCVEFITLISSEANDISEKEAKKTIACEHVERALRDLGFADYIPDVLAVAEEHREQLKVCGLPLHLFYVAVFFLHFCRDSRARKSRAKWSRAGYPRNSCYNSSRSCSGLRLKNTMLFPSEVRNAGGFVLAIEGFWSFCLLGIGVGVPYWSLGCNVA